MQLTLPIEMEILKKQPKKHFNCVRASCAARYKYRIMSLWSCGATYRDRGVVGQLRGSFHNQNKSKRWA